MNQYICNIQDSVWFCLRSVVQYICLRDKYQYLKGSMHPITNQTWKSVRFASAYPHGHFIYHKDSDTSTLHKTYPTTRNWFSTKNRCLHPPGSLPLPLYESYRAHKISWLHDRCYYIDLYIAHFFLSALCDQLKLGDWKIKCWQLISGWHSL